MSSPLREQKTTAEDGVPQAWFGLPVALSGVNALVGSRNAAVNGTSIQGAVYAFVRIRGIWKQTQKLVASDGVAGDQFGTSIAIFGNTAVVTAPLAKINGNTWQGAAYVFELSNGFWKQTQKLVAKTGAAFSTLGTGTGLTAEYLFVGAGGVFNQGVYAPRRVHVFKFIPSKTGGKWIESQVLETPAPDDPISSFGTAIALSGNSALVGARASRVGNNLGQGMVYGYTESNGTWSLTDKLTGSDSGARDNFGNSVAMSGAVAVMGAPGAVINGNISQGAVYVFNKSKAGRWTQVSKFTADDGDAIDLFGASVNLSDSSVLVGAYGIQSYTGAAYLFQKKGNTWVQARRLSASDGTPGQIYGYSTALDGATALVGAYAATVDGNQAQGAAYFYSRRGLSG